MGKYSHRDEVVISRMRLGHTLLTYGYLTDNDVPDVAPHRELCALLSVKHIMVECQRGRVDDLSFFDSLSPFCFLSIEFHFTFSISYKLLPYLFYYYCI